MKTIDISQLTENPQRYLDEAQEEAIVVTSEGLPRAVLHGVDDDVETAELVRSSEFWEMIRERRKQPTIPLDEVKRRLQDAP
jgi:hypothetical protein